MQPSPPFTDWESRLARMIRHAGQLECDNLVVCIASFYGNLAKVGLELV